MKNLIDEEHVDRIRYTDMRLHHISAGAELLKLSVSSKLNAEWEFLEYLHQVGHKTADQWLEANFDKLGRESTLDLSALSFAEMSEEKRIA